MARRGNPRHAPRQRPRHRRRGAPEGDKLYSAAATIGIPVGGPGRTLPAARVPPGTDLIVCAHAHTFITDAAIAKARHGAIGYHPSLLPRHRGRDAIRWALHMSDPVTGGTVYWMTNHADAGPIAAQDWCWIRPDDTPMSLWQRDLAPMALRPLARVIDDIAQGTATRTEQDEALATWEPSFNRPKLGAG